MDSESLEQIERQLTGLRPGGAPRELRAAVLTGVEHELRAARWDRRLARAAVILLAVGVGLNMATGMAAGSRSRQQAGIAAAGSRQSLVDTAIVVAEATDAATGSRYARQLAAMSGQELTADEAAAIDAAVERATTHELANGSKG